MLECEGNQLNYDLRQRVDEFATHEALEELSLGRARGPRDRGFDFQRIACDELVRCVMRSSPKLSQLCLNGWTGIGGANVNDVIQACPALRELRLRDVRAGGGRKEVIRRRGWMSYFRGDHL